jgi:hypothetical protein
MFDGIEILLGLKIENDVILLVNFHIENDRSR